MLNEQVSIVVRTSRFKRSRNGAWLDAGATTVERGVSNVDVGAHLHGASTQSITATWSDGVSVSVAYGNTPVRGYGWGPYGYVKNADNPLGREGVRLHPRLPGYALAYYGVKRLSQEVLDTFEVYRPNY